MPQRTLLAQQLPWVGGVNTSQDEALISPQALTVADNVIFATRGSRRKRDGLQYNWDNATNSSVSLYGLHEFWFGDLTKTQRLTAISTDRKLFSVTSGGLRTEIPIAGRPWEGVVDEISMVTYNNRCIIAVNGLNNYVKQWNGIEATARDLRNTYAHTLATLGRSSTGTTRTLILNATFKGAVGEFVVISGTSAPVAADYDGTYQVDVISTTNVPNDTIKYIGPTSLNESPATDTAMDINGVAPNASILREQLGRLSANDKTRRDRLHYSGSFNHEQWQGFGDSGALDIGVGDGDPEGITAIFPTFKGELFVAKRTKLYRVSGYSPETFTVNLVSSGIGCVSHNSIALIDQDDMFFVSEKGVHTINATSNFGDFNAAFVSSDIQKTFIENFSRPRLKYVKAAYNPEINSVGFCFTDSNLPNGTNTTLSVNNCIWLYNIQFKAWYRWSDIPSQSMIVATDGDKKRFYFGSHTNRIIKSFTGNNYDLDYTGARAGIRFKVVTGQWLIDDSLYTVKGFKRFIMYYKPEGTHTHTVRVQIDGIPIDSVNTLSYSEVALGILLGVNFILGQSPLGFDVRLAGYTRTIDGFGSTCKITIENFNINETIEVQGIAVEWEPAGTSPEAGSR